MIDNQNLLKRIAEKIPVKIRKMIIEQKMIESAQNIQVEDSPMQFLFDVHCEFIEPGGDNSLWSCYKCRDKVLQDFRKLQPFINSLNNAS